LKQSRKLASLIFWSGQVNLYAGLEFNHADLSGLDEFIYHSVDKISEKERELNNDKK